MSISEEVASYNTEVESFLSIIIKPGRNMFYWKNFVLRVTLILACRGVVCKVIQTSNVNYSLGAIIIFQNVE